jgi:hypothetical protein
MFDVVIVMQWSVAVCPMVVYLLKHLIHFVIDTKTVDTCFYTWRVSGIFDLAKFDLAKFAYSSHHLAKFAFLTPSTCRNTCQQFLCRKQNESNA